MEKTVTVKTPEGAIIPILTDAEFAELEKKMDAEQNLGLENDELSNKETETEDCPIGV